MDHCETCSQNYRHIISLGHVTSPRLSTIPHNLPARRI